MKIGPHSAAGGLGSTQVIVAWNGSVPVSWTNTSTGESTCSWSFGSGTSPTTSTFCSPSRSTYTVKGTYTVTLTVNGSATANFTVLAACQVPNFANVKKDRAQQTWNDAGFTTTVQFFDNDNNGNYSIGTQSTSGGTLNPSDGCSGATMKVGP